MCIDFKGIQWFQKALGLPLYLTNTKANKPARVFKSEQNDISLVRFIKKRYMYTNVIILIILICW